MDDDRRRQDDVRATADSLVADADRLDEVEATKAELDVDDPRLPGLAEEATRLTEKMAAKARIQERLIKDSQRDPG
jgi:hypothetical protein